MGAPILTPRSWPDPGVARDAGAHHHGIRVEGGNFGEIDHNEVFTTSLPDVAFGATSLNLDASGAGGAGNEIHGNQFTAVLADGSIVCSGGLPTMAGWLRGSAPTEPNQVHDNRFVSIGDTLVIEDPSLADAWDNEETEL